jgi:hypothetical protein
MIKTWYKETPFRSEGNLIAPINQIYATTLTVVFSKRFENDLGGLSSPCGFTKRAV